ncbi:MAG: hypothetical protein OXH00_02840 [Candidatus Poribacteria bacterium]|nr:hypothetical protein [Candidatus Poribacteria bacterium]
MTQPQMGKNMKKLTDIYFGFEDMLIGLGYSGSEIGYLWAEYAEKYLPKLLQKAGNE